MAYHFAHFAKGKIVINTLFHMSWSSHVKLMGLGYLHLFRELFGNTLDIFLGPIFRIEGLMVF